MKFADNLYVSVYTGTNEISSEFRNPLLSELDSENNITSIAEEFIIPTETLTQVYNSEFQDEYIRDLWSNFPRIVISPLNTTYPIYVIAFVGYASGSRPMLFTTTYISESDNNTGGLISGIDANLLVGTIAAKDSSIFLIISDDSNFVNKIDNRYIDFNYSIIETEIESIYNEQNPIYLSGRGSDYKTYLRVYANYSDKGYSERLDKDLFTVESEDIDNGIISVGRTIILGNYYYFSESTTETTATLTVILKSDSNIRTTVRLILGDPPPYYQNGDSTTGGGNGSYGQGENFFDTLGKIPNGSAEANDSRGTMYTRYLVSLNEMSTLGDWLWADDLGLQIAKTAISLLYGDPVQTVISCVSYPFNLSNVASSSSVPFHWGGHNAGFNLSALNQNAFSIDWGTITISEYWGNFLDYSPHTQMQLYLPWGTGFVHIDPNDILKSNSGFNGSGALGIKTNVDLSRGICVHNVIANNTVIGSYSGSCGRQIPITGSDYASKQVSMAGAAIGAMVAGGVVAGSAYSQYSNLEAVPSPTGRYSGGASDGILRKQDAAGRYHDIKTGKFVSAPTPRRYDVVHGEVDKGSMTRLAANVSRPAVASAASILVSPPSVSRSGSFQEGAGSLSIQQPYLIISRPKMSIPNNYGHLYGYPSNIYSYLGSLTGYTEVGAVHLDGLPATAEEISEIDSLLKGGVIL